MELATLLPPLLLVAWLLPLASFAAIVFFGSRMGRAGHAAGYVATGAIGASLLLSLVALFAWLGHYPPQPPHHAQQAAAQHTAAEPADSPGGEETAPHSAGAQRASKPALSGQWYTLCRFGSLRLTIGYYIDALTLAMFVMVTLISTCIHVYSFGYMHEELDDVRDPLVTLANGRTLVRPGRFHRFYQYLSLFCFSMLGLVVAGNLAMVFIFWELVGICSYLLIGFYVERHSASTAANKAFIVNRVGDFGMIIGLMALWAGLGTLAFGDVEQPGGPARPGIFSQVRPAQNAHALTVPDGMVRLAARHRVEAIYRQTGDARLAETMIAQRIAPWRGEGYGYGLLLIAGLGIFCGCVGKSAQFPLHVWLPDAMEGPTPVSALIHAATMVAAGVYLVGRFYPVFTPEVLLVIACIGTITLFMAATIAIVATDIKRVLAYSTVSQLGYMMMALGVGGWAAGLFHLFTHACFKSLLFLCSGSVIHACHTNEMPEMGGLRKKMPWTAWTMMAGCLAISGAGIPLLIGLSGFHSKDAILAQAFSFQRHTAGQGWIFWVAAAGAAITAFYMFRLWFMTFAGRPRNEHVAEHAHESPPVMTIPLVILATLAVIAGWTIPWTNLGLVNLLEQARPLGTAEGITGGLDLPRLVMPAEYLSHEPSVHVPVSWIAFGTALAGFLLATAFYGLRKLDPARAKNAFRPVYGFLWNKWFFDELYQLMFVRSALAAAWLAAWFDRKVIDGIADGLARLTVGVARLDRLIDEHLVDRMVNGIAASTYGLGLRLRPIQSGRLRQYVMMIALSTVTLFLLVSVYRHYAIGL